MLEITAHSSPKVKHDAIVVELDERHGRIHTQISAWNREIRREYQEDEIGYTMRVSEHNYNGNKYNMRWKKK